MKRFTLYIIYVLLPALAFPAAAGNIHNLSKKCEEARSLSQYDKLEVYSAELLRLADDKDDQRQLTYGYFYNGLAKLFKGRGEESLQMLDRADELSSRIHNDSVRALVMNTRGIYHAMIQNNNFVAQQYFFRSLELAEKSGFQDLVHRVRGNLLTLSHSMGDSLALASATDVYNYGMEIGNYEQLSMGAYYLATYYYKHDMYDETEKYLNIALDTYRKYPYEDISSVYALYAKMLITKSDYVKAESMVLKAIDMAKKYNQLSMEIDACITYAELLYARKEYQRSADMVRDAMESADRIGITNKVIDCSQILANDLIAMGRNADAVQCLQKANELLSSQATINMERLSHEQQIMRDIQQHELDAKLNQEKVASQRIMLILLAIIVVVLLVLLGFIISSYRRRQVLYRKIVLQNSRSVARQRELQHQIALLSKELEQNSDGKPQAETAADKETFALGDEKIDRLYTELCRLMDAERLYTEAQLTREKMAERLGTNRTYLTKVIKEKTGMNYLQYINSYRINEAIRILSDKDNVNYPLKQIWSDLGFSSPSTFFKLFQQAVGITPSTYRKQFLEVNSEPADDDEDNIV